MHELSVARALLNLVAPLARRHAAPVTRVVVRIGPLSGVDPALLRRAFPQAAMGTCAEGAILQLEPAPLRVRCLACGAESGATINRLDCAICGATRTQLLAGDDLHLLRVELEPADAPMEAKEAHV